MNYSTTFTSVEDLNCEGRSSIDFKVKGFWGISPINVYVRRCAHHLDRGEWTVDVSHSSGGRDKDEVQSDAEAARYFAEAMVAAADIADLIASKFDVLEQQYREYRARQKAEFEAERAAFEAKQEADAPLGEGKAKELIARLIGGEISSINIHARGCEGKEPHALTCTTRMKTNLYFLNSIIAKKDAIDMLVRSSHRTYAVV